MLLIYGGFQAFLFVFQHLLRATEIRDRWENIQNEKRNKIMFKTIKSTKAVKSETTVLATPQHNLTPGLPGLISFQACSKLDQVDVAEVQYLHPAIIEQTVKRKSMK